MSRYHFHWRVRASFANRFAPLPQLSRWISAIVSQSPVLKAWLGKTGWSTHTVDATEIWWAPTDLGTENIPVHFSVSSTHEPGCNELPWISRPSPRNRAPKSYVLSKGQRLSSKHVLGSFIFETRGKNQWSFHDEFSYIDMFFRVVVSRIVCVPPYLGRWSNVTKIFDMNWDH